MDGVMTKADIKKCGNCKYFTKLVDTDGSFGDCDWFLSNEIPLMPIWCHPNTQHGSLSPTQQGCAVWEKVE